MDVLSLMIKRTEYAIGTSIEDMLLKEVAHSSEDEVAIILTENSLNQLGKNKEAIIKLLEKYQLKAMFDLKNPYSNTNVSFFLYVFCREKQDKIIYGIYKDILKSKRNREDRLSLHEEFPIDYFDYIDNIEKYLLTGICPEDTEKVEFGFFDSKLKAEKCWNPNRYNKTAIKVRNALNKEKTVFLQDIATIIRPRPDFNKNKVPFCAMPNNWQYPVNYERFREGIATDTPLIKGDIVLFDNANMFLVYDNLDNEVHTSPNCFIIRPKNEMISSEYLFMYLNSDTAQLIMESEAIGTYFKKIRRSDLEQFKIIVPTKSEQYYREIFFADKFPLKDIERINQTIFSTDNTAENIEDILDLELIKKLKVYKEDVKEKILAEDLKEINVCFKNKAYKAALILAGSVLEAVLIDWLSEIHQVNYFENEYYDHNGNKGTLAIYIRDIKYLKRPGWIDEAEKAYTIKEKRNLVHAKLCLNTEEINEQTCREVISYLEDVLKTRNGKIVKRPYR